MVRKESAADHNAIREVNRLAFQSDLEGNLIDALRSDGLVIVSLVFEADGLIAGHILFSRLDVVGLPIQTAALGPMAVLPSHQRRGIGTDLVNQGLKVCRELRFDVVTVVGHPEYYPRFGFSAGLAKLVESPYSEYGDAWMALELSTGALRGERVRVVYPGAWSAV